MFRRKFLKTAAAGVIVPTVFKLDKEVKLEVKLGDVGMVPHASQYIEGIFKQYDKNGDGALKTAEALA